MSEQQFKSFLEAVKADKVLQDKLKNAGDADAFVAIAKQAGYEISADDLKIYQANLSEEELEKVSGGTVTTVAVGAEIGVTVSLQIC